MPLITHKNTITNQPESASTRRRGRPRGSKNKAKDEI